MREIRKTLLITVLHMVRCWWGVNTRDMEIKVTDEKIDIFVDYELDVNHEPMADCRIKMNIMPKRK